MTPSNAAAGPSPSGVVTMLLSDIEGSTRLARALGERWRDALAIHREIVFGRIERHRGVVTGTEGDSVASFFERPEDALAAAVEIQRELRAASWPEAAQVTVRMGVHTGVVERQETDYVGIEIHRAARVCSAAAGGQVLVTQATRALLGDSGFELEDVGEHRLKDFPAAERLFHVVIDGRNASAFPPPRGGVSLSNLPPEVSSFVGRERNLEELRELLARARMVSLTGPGGVGKTRLALRIAAEVCDDFADGAWFVDLARIADGSLVVPALAEVLGVREQAHRSRLDTVLDAVSERRLLVLLDNCEHVIAAAAELAARLMSTCPGVSILATTREPLKIAGEHVYAVDVLEIPASGEDDPAAIAASESVRLLLDRGHARAATLELDSANAGAIAQICRRLDGMPLALELAAARLATMSASELNTRLDERFRVLRSGSRDAAPRHRTLQAVIDWSWELLTGSGRALLARLSVFAGSFDTRAAEDVAACAEIARADVLDELAGLAERSLVQVESDGEVTRYRLLETVREYARARLADGGALQATRRAHRDHYLALAEDARRGLASNEAPRWFERLEHERANVRAAMRTSLEDDDVDTGLHLVIALTRFWSSRGPATEGLEMLERLLAQAPADTAESLRVRALSAIAYMSLKNLDDIEGGRRVAETALAEARSLGDDRLVCEALCNLAWSLSLEGDDRAALAVSREALSSPGSKSDPELLARVRDAEAFALDGVGEREAARAAWTSAREFFLASGDREEVAGVEDHLANLAIQHNELALARCHLTAALPLFEELGGGATAVVPTLNLALVEYLEGNVREARERFTRGLAEARRWGDQQSVAFAISSIALAQSALGDVRGAAMLHGAADAYMETMPRVLDRVEVGLRSADQARLREAMGEDAFNLAYADGGRMSLEQTFALIDELR